MAPAWEAMADDAGTCCKTVPQMRLWVGVAKLGQPHRATGLGWQAQGWGRLGVGLRPSHPMVRISPARNETNRGADAARAPTPPPSAWQPGLGGHAKVRASNTATMDDIFITSILAPPRARVKPRLHTRVPGPRRVRWLDGTAQCVHRGGSSTCCGCLPRSLDSKVV